MIIAIDFDGTIVDHDYPNIGKPVPGAISMLQNLHTEGHQLILWTMRSGPQLDEAIKYLDQCGVSLWGINENPQQHRWTNSPKAYANIYIDDAALGCPTIMLAGFRRPCVNWLEVATMLAQKGI